jgi:hypothetical protein
VKAETHRMPRLAPAVPEVGDDGVAEVCCVDADLVSTARFQNGLQVCQRLTVVHETCEDPEVRRR